MNIDHYYFKSKEDSELVLSIDPQKQSLSTPKLFRYIWILKYPDYPQNVPQLFLPIQY